MNAQTATETEDYSRAAAVFCVVCEAEPGDSCRTRPFGTLRDPHNARQRDAGIGRAVEFSAMRSVVAVTTVAGAENRRAPSDDDELCRSGRSVQYYTTETGARAKSACTI